MAVLVLVVGCESPPAAKRKATVQEPPLKQTPVEVLEAKVRRLEERQRALLQKRAELQGEFDGLTQTQGDLVALRDEVLEARRRATERAASLESVETEALAQQRVARAMVARAPKAGGAGKMPFVVHTTSYRAARQALNDANRLARLGYQAYTSRADLGPKGVWYRTLVDRFTSLEEARSFSRRLKERGRLSYAAPMRLPYTVDLDAYTTMEAAREAKSALKRKGLHPYVSKERGPGGSTIYRLRVGAFKKRSEAQAAAERAARAGAASDVVRP